MAKKSSADSALENLLSTQAEDITDDDLCEAISMLEGDESINVEVILYLAVVLCVCS